MVYKAILKQGYHEIEFNFNTISELTEFMHNALSHATSDISFVVLIVKDELVCKGESADEE